jgi:hypothetical protein
MLRLESETDLFMMRAKTPLFTAPFVHSKLRKRGEYVSKYTVITVLDSYRIDHSSVFGIKFLRIPQGWLPDRVKTKSTTLNATPAVVKERSPDGNILFKSCSFQVIRPWAAPEWKSNKIWEVEVPSEATFQVDLVIKTEDGAEWVRMKTEGHWLPLKHPNMTSGVIQKANEEASTSR